MGNDAKVWSEEELNALSYNDIRKMCKANGIKAAGKKVDLLDALIKTLVHAPAQGEESVEKPPKEPSVGTDQSGEDVESPKKMQDEKEANDSPPALPTEEERPTETSIEEESSAETEPIETTEAAEEKEANAQPEPTAEPQEEEAVEILVQRTTVVKEVVLNTTITLESSSLPSESVVNITDDRTASTVRIGGGLDETRSLSEPRASDVPEESREQAAEITDDEEEAPKAQTEAAADPDEIPELDGDELMDVDDQSTVDSLLPSNETFRVEEPLNSTYTKSDSNSQGGSQEEEPTAELSADLSHGPSGLGGAHEAERPLLESAPRLEVARVDHEGMDYRENSPPLLTTPLAHSNAFPSKIPRLQGSAAERFAAAHQQNFAKMPSIEETLKAKEERQQKLRNYDERINRLATPKQQTPPRRRAETPASTNPTVFEFRATTRDQAASEPPSAAPRKFASARKPQEDVKTLTKRSQKETARAQSVIPATIPDCSERINQLATPKGADRAISIPRERRLFTPKSGKFEYVDTTKMSNSAFEMHKRKLRLQDAHSERRQ